MENGIPNGQTTQDENIDPNRLVDSHVEDDIPRPLSACAASSSHSSVTSYTNTVASHSKRKLVLHFDVRNTILVANSVDNIKEEQALNSFLTCVMWGKQTDMGWQWYSDMPSLRCPHPDAQTYYKYLERQIVHVPSDRVRLRRVTGDFTQEDIGRRFSKYFHTTLEHLAWRHLEGRRNTALTVKGKDGTPYHYILPAVYKLIHHLHRTKREFSVIVRTFGRDAHNVLQAMKVTMQGNHPEFPEKLPVEVNTNFGKIIRTDDTMTMQIPSDQGTAVLHNERTISNHLSATKGISAFVDDFIHWQSNDYSYLCAKPLWVDPNDKKVQHIFFDDNIRITDADNIVDVRFFDSADSDKARSLTGEEMEKFENMCLVQSNLLESASDNDYFINKVDVCERLYDDFMQSYSSQCE